MYSITRFSRRGKDFPQFPSLPLSIVGESQLIYVQRYVSDEAINLVNFEVVGGQLHVISSTTKEVRFLLLMVMTVAHYTTDGQRISFLLFYYVDSLFQCHILIRRSTNFLRQFYFSLNRFHAIFLWEIGLPMWFKSFFCFLIGFQPFDPHLITSIICQWLTCACVCGGK